MTKHTEKAVKAAEKIVDFLGITKENGIHTTIAGIIDDKTGLPEITAERDMLKRQIEVNAIVGDDTVAERDRLRESTRICLSWIKTVAGKTPNRMTREIMKKAEAALANPKPESGEKENGNEDNQE